MKLNKKQRIILFVILSFIYILFFNLYSVKAITYDAPIQLDLRYRLQDNSGSAVETFDSSHIDSFAFYDIPFYHPKAPEIIPGRPEPEIGQVYYEYRATIANKNNKPYNAFIFFSPIQLNISGSSVNDLNFDSSALCIKSNDSSCVTEVTTNTSTPLYFYILKTGRLNNLSLYHYSTWWPYGDNILFGASSLYISELYGFDTESDRDNYISSLVNNLSNQTTYPPGFDDEGIGDLQQQIKDSLNSSDVDSTGWGASISFWHQKNTNNGVITNIVTLPITFLQLIINNYDNFCSPITLGTLYNYTFRLPCVDLSHYLGSTLWGIIDLILSGMLIYKICNRFVVIFDDLTNLRDNQISDLYGGGR